MKLIFNPSCPLWSPAAAAQLLQSCPTLCDPRDGSPPGSPVPGILQARTLEWVAIAFSHAWKWKVKVKLLSRVQLLATPWTAASHAPLSMGFSRQEYWSRVPLPSLYDYLENLKKFLSQGPTSDQLNHNLLGAALRHKNVLKKIPGGFSCVARMKTADIKVWGLCLAYGRHINVSSIFFLL